MSRLPELGSTLRQTGNLVFYNNERAFYWKLNEHHEHNHKVLFPNFPIFSPIQYNISVNNIEKGRSSGTAWSMIKLK